MRILKIEEQYLVLSCSACLYVFDLQSFKWFDLQSFKWFDSLITTLHTIF